MKQNSLKENTFNWWGKMCPSVGRWKGLVGNFTTTLYGKKCSAMERAREQFEKFSKNNSIAEGRGLA